MNLLILPASAVITTVAVTSVFIWICREVRREQKLKRNWLAWKTKRVMLKRGRFSWDTLDREYQEVLLEEIFRYSLYLTARKITSPAERAYLNELLALIPDGKLQ